MTQTLRFGILGTGFISNKAASTFEVLGKDAVLTAAASRSAEKSAAFAAQYGIPKSCSSYEELAADPEVDVVYIGTPHNFHLENIRMCAEHGKHVVCEKPIAISGEEAREIARLSQEHKVFIMEAYWTVFLPAWEKARELLRSGAIGRYEFLRAELGFSHPGARGLRKIDPKLAGGSMLDLGVYNIMLAYQIFGRDVKDVRIKSCLNEYGIDLYNAFDMTFADGSLAYLMDTVKGKFDNKAVIYGEKGCVTIHNFLGSSKVTLDALGEPSEDFAFPFEKNGFEYELRHACRCIREGLTESPIMPLSESVAILDRADRLMAASGITSAHCK